MNLTSTAAQNQTGLVPFLCSLNFPQQPASSEWGLSGCWTPAKWHCTLLTKQYPPAVLFPDRYLFWTPSRECSDSSHPWSFGLVPRETSSCYVLFMVPPRLLSSLWKSVVGVRTINEPEIKFDCHNKTVPLCAESLQPESEIRGKVCVLRFFRGSIHRGKKTTNQPIVIHIVLE